MEKINYLDQYGRNNLTEKPLEYYLEAFEKQTHTKSAAV